MRGAFWLGDKKLPPRSVFGSWFHTEVFWTMRTYTVCAIALVLSCSALMTASGAEDSENEIRPYVSGIVGSSFATLASGGTNTAAAAPTANSGSMNGDLFTAGGAIGLAIDRSHGQLRLEVEGRGRDAMTGTTPSVVNPFAYDVAAKDGWSVTTNLWRDLFLDDHWGLYAGGGIGGGGYRLSVADNVVSAYEHVGGFAWQAGGGVTWRMADRVTLDLGYRWFAIDTLSSPLALSDGTPAGNYTSTFGASELLLSVRIYEPFRRAWR